MKKTYRKKADKMSYDYEKERQEAIRAGERALNSLSSAFFELKSARNWGIVDIV